MSHTRNIKVNMSDLQALKRAAKRLGIKLERGTFKLFNTTETGIGFKLPGWQHYAVLKKGGELAIDDYNGRWGDIAELKKLESFYALEKMKLEAEKSGYRTEEYTKENGNPGLRMLVA